MSKILVTGGCGYIGSHTIVDLLQNGFDVISADNFVRSTAQTLAGIKAITGIDVPNYNVDLCDAAATAQIFAENPDIMGVIHFAALKSVPESVAQPLVYYQNNLNTLVNVLHNVKQYKIPYFIFSSSCSVYGNVAELPVVETTPLGKAESPYARTKQMGEQIVQDLIASNPHTRAILLRYFNPAGAHPSIELGEIPQAGSYNMVPILTETAIGIRQQFTVMGSDYPTRDGSCIRDYIHIIDLADAHTKCLQYLQANSNEQACEVFNVGIGQGVTVLEAIHAFERASGKPLNYAVGGRRAGDIAAIYADYTRAAQRLGWQPRYTVDDIMHTAWQWQLKLSNN